MARLPDPVTEKIEVGWEENYKERQNVFYKLIGQAIRNRNKEEREEEKSKE